MSIVAIDPQLVRAQSTSKKTSALSGASFSDVMSASNAPVSHAVAINQDYRAAAVTSASISGLAQTPGAVANPAGNSPYFLQANEFRYGNGIPLSGVPLSGVPGSYPYPGYGASTNPYGPLGGGDNLDRQFQLAKVMEDTNLNYMGLQMTVQNISRDYQAASNIIKTKFDAESNSVRNLKA